MLGQLYPLRPIENIDTADLVMHSCTLRPCLKNKKIQRTSVLTRD